MNKPASPQPLTERVKKSRAKAVKEGAQRLDVWLTPEAAEALTDEVSRTGESKTAVVNRLILAAKH